MWWIEIGKMMGRTLARALRRSHNGFRDELGHPGLWKQYYNQMFSVLCSCLMG